MTVLLTQCPHCQTSFRVSTAQLSAANGLVRCGSCLGVFSASANEIRIKHPDGYVVEELESADELEEEHWSPSDDNSRPPDNTPERLREEPENDSVNEQGNGQVSSPAYEQSYAPPEATDWHDDGPAISLGDMRLDDDYLADDEETYEEHSEPVAGHDADDVLFDVSAAVATAPDDQSGHESSEITAGQYEENFQEDFEEEFDEQLAEELQEESDEESDEEFDEESEEESAEESDDEEPATPSWTAPFAETPDYRLTAEKRDLRAHLSSLADEDALGPLDDDHLDSLEELPVTINNSNRLRSRLNQAALLLLNVILLLALPVPWLYTHRDELSTHRRFSFMAPLVCNIVTCAPPVTGKTTTLYSQQLLVRTHPRFEDALEVSFVFHNDSTLSQPFPNLELAFSDVDNKLLANRLFMPQEYLPPELRQLGAMPASSSVQVMLEVADPGQNAVNYTVKLHTP
ncbi:MAG: DUF3426 domain-containing protein [Pseudomonadota bacterium]